MKPARVILALLVAFALETTLARLVPGAPAMDLLLVVVVYVALRSGPVNGLLTGAAAGLIQDFGMSSGIIGIGGLGKTLVGFFAGIIGTQLIVTQALPRFVVFFGATLLFRFVSLAIGALLDLRTFGVPYTVALEGLVNGAVGVVVFRVTETVSRASDARRVRR